MGYKRLAWLMIDQDVAYLRPSQVYRVLQEAQLPARRPMLPADLKRPPAPDHPDQVWHLDLMYLFVWPRWYYLAEGVGQAQQPTKEALRTTWLHAITRPKPDPEAALADDRPRIAIVTATTGVAMDDIRRQLQEAEADVEIDTHAVPINQPERVARAIQEAAAAADLVVLTRGGGTGVDDLDTGQVIEAIASCPVATVAAVGHASDVLAVEQVAHGERRRSRIPKIDDPSAPACRACAAAPAGSTTALVCPSASGVIAPAASTSVSWCANR